MKETGIVRKVDELGRIVLPVELRRTLGISEKGQMEIYITGDTIVLKKYTQGCAFCQSTNHVVQIKSLLVCTDCVNEIKTV